MTTTASGSGGTPSERWKQLNELEADIQHLRKQQDDAKAGIDSHRKKYEEIQEVMAQLPAEQADHARKNIKAEKDAWAKAEKTYKDVVKDLTALENRKRKLMTDMDKEMSDREQMRPRREGRTETESMTELVRTIVEATQAAAATGKGTSTTTSSAPRTRSLANLPMLSKPGNFLEHLTKLETYFRINEVNKSADKKDILMLSLSADVANRAQGIDANVPPFDGQDWRDFAESVRSRMIPKASAAILRSQFEGMRQAPAEYSVDYLVRKNALFLKAFPGDTRGDRAMPVSYLVRHLVDGLYHEDLKAEIWREIRGGIDENDERDIDSVNDAFDTLLQATNLTLDFVRRNLHIKEDVDKRGLSIVSRANADSKTESVKTASATGSSYVNQVDDTEEERWEEAGEEYHYDEEEEDAETPLTEEVISYCELVEDEDQSLFWNAEEINEASGGAGTQNKEGEGRRACWVCGSFFHYKRQCPQRLKAVTNRVNALVQGGGRRGRSGGRRGWTSTRRPGSSRGRGRSGFSAFAPFGRGASGRGRFYPPGQQPTWYPSATQGSSSRGWNSKDQYPF